jgi:hypothetical protein
MSDTPEPKDLETVLARLKEEWQELVDLLTSQGKGQERVIEVEQILLRDAAGHLRGKISAPTDGSADLLLSGPEGDAWIRLGVTRDGEAFLELKDQKGVSRFKAADDAPSPGAPAGPAAPPPDAPTADNAPQPSAPAAAPPTTRPGSPPGGAANLELAGRVEKLERQHRRQKIYGGLILGALGVILAIAVLTLFCPQRTALSVASLTVRDRNGDVCATLGTEAGKVQLDLWDRQKTRRAALGLGPDGGPHLAFYDRDQQLRAELTLGPDGEPRFTLRDRRSLQGQADPNDLSNSAQVQPPGGAVSGSEAGTLASPLVSQAAAFSPQPAAETEGEYVGFKISNKYHYPTCKWARGANPRNSIKFKSAAEAQGRHYVPCPVCKPPPLSP